MHIIKPVQTDEAVGVGVFILVPECGIDIELLEIFDKLFDGKGGWYAKGSHLELLCEKNDDGSYKYPTTKI